MAITKQQIERFFNNQCSREDADAIANYLEAHPDVLREYVRPDWDAASEGPGLPASQGQRMLREIRKEIFATRQGAVVKPLGRRSNSWVAAAAAILLVAGIGSLVALRTGSNAVASNDPVEIKAPVTGDLQPVTRVQFNNTEKDQVIALPDGSMAILSAGSTLRYVDSFERHRRAVYLEGQASFTIAKEESRPFTVSAGPMLATVLGTAFRVTEQEGGVTVRLFSGKVKLQPKDKVLKGWGEAIVLLPGEQLQYFATRGLVEVVGFEKIGKPIPVKGSGNDKEAHVFLHKPLPEVLDQLAAHFHTHISYDKAGIGGLYFSGTVLASESLVTTLELITNMNDLIIVQDREGYIIQRNIP